MLLKRTIILVIFFWQMANAFAQSCTGNGRYLQRVFPHVTKTADIQFATVQALPSVYINETQTVSQNLYLDVFQPTGDTLPKRPLVILAFGGAYVIGTKNDADIQAACDSLAHLGYVTASIQYRLGLNPTSAESGERAVYRSAQDYSAAVRYFKQHAALYKIDTAAIFVGGASAGSFAAMHMAYGEDDERPASTFASGGVFPKPDLGCMDCSGNSYPFSHKVRGILNMWGAIGYLDWIEPNDPPIVSFHGNMDPLVPYSQGYPFTTGATLPYVYGSAKITERMLQLGIYNELYTYESAIHQLWGGALQSTWAFGPTEFQQPILNGIRLFLYKQLKPTHTQLSGNDIVCTGAEVWYSVTYRPGFKYCWQIQNGQVVQMNNHQLKVKWNTAGMGQVSVREFNHLDIPADSFLVKNVVVHQTPTVHITGENSICTGDTAQLIASGAFSYQWNHGNIVSNAQADSILAWPAQTTTLTVTGNSAENCSSTSQFTIQVNPLPIAPIITRMAGVLFIPDQYQTYQWFLDGQIISGATSHSVNILQNATYTVQVGQGNDCYILSFPYSVQNVSVTEWNQTQIKVFPNPFEDCINISGIQPGISVGKISDITGKEIYSFYIESDGADFQINMENKPAGVYVLRLRNEAGDEFYSRIIRR